MRFAKTRLLLGAAVLLGVVAKGPATAQDCNALLTHGLRNIEVTQSSAASLATKYYRNCGSDIDKMEKSAFAQAEVEIYGSGAGEGSWGESERRSRVKEWCRLNSEAAQAAKSGYQSSQTIMDSAVAAWSQCNALAARGVRTNPRISGNGKVVDLSVSNSFPGSVDFYGVAATGFDCRIHVPGKSAAESQEIQAKGLPIPLGPQAIAVHCERKSEDRELDGKKYTWLDSATIAIQTASDPYQLFFPEETNPPLPDAVANALLQRVENLERGSPPAGSIIAFAGLVTPAGYLDCDGSTVRRDQYASLFNAIGTVWGAGDLVTTFNLPDSRGRFLRGADGGTGRDPDAAARKACQPGGATGPIVGTCQ